MRHDPETNAAAYLSGDMPPRRRRAFEHHMLECEECWSEVEIGRRGRSLAEAARELAPQPLRERVRMSVAATSVPERRWTRRVTGIAAVIAVALVVSVIALVAILPSAGQPREIALLIADFNDEAAMGAAATTTLPARLGVLRLRDARSRLVDGMDVSAHEYSDPAGHRVVVYQADATFPVADGAELGSEGKTWIAHAGGRVLFCADRPVPSLVIGDDQHMVMLAATELGLR